mmetsp:Transcript_23927/g.70243  ORF Transcript_23927/g.70243 Transcript_23927/m.70243 type:complete len:341 (+) Transcript_23927:530-1552(+)
MGRLRAGRGGGAGAAAGQRGRAHRRGAGPGGEDRHRDAAGGRRPERALDRRRERARGVRGRGAAAAARQAAEGGRQRRRPELHRPQRARLGVDERLSAVRQAAAVGWRDGRPGVRAAEGDGAHVRRAERPPRRLRRAAHRGGRPDATRRVRRVGRGGGAPLRDNGAGAGVGLQAVGAEHRGARAGDRGRAAAVAAALPAQPRQGRRGVAQGPVQDHLAARRVAPPEATRSGLRALAAARQPLLVDRLRRRHAAGACRAVGAAGGGAGQPGERAHAAVGRRPRSRRRLRQGAHRAKPATLQRRHRAEQRGPPHGHPTVGRGAAGRRASRGVCHEGVPGRAG